MLMPMHNSPRWLSRLTLTLCVIPITACEDPTDTTRTDDAVLSSNITAQNQVPQGALPRFPELIPHLNGSTIDVTDRLRRFAEDDAALITAVREANGLVSIGIKPPGAAPLAVSGLIPDMSKQQALAGRVAVEAVGATIVQSFANMSTVIAEIDPDDAPEIRNLPLVSYVEPPGPDGEVARVPGNPGNIGRLGPTASMVPLPQDTSWGVHKVRAPWVWENVGNGRGEGVFITILDTGIDSAHVWNLYGDANAYDVSDFSCLHSALVTDNCYDESLDPHLGLIGHGTLVHSVAMSADGPSGYIGIAHGIAGNASIKVCNPGCHPFAVANGLDWALTNSASYPKSVVNMSFSSEEFAAVEQQAVNNAAQAGLLLIAAAGNLPSEYPQIGYPAAFANVLAITGTLENDAFAQNFTSLSICHRNFGVGSKSGPEAFLSAPFWSWGMFVGGGYGTQCGTSFAAPVVTAVAAQIWAAFPNYTSYDVAWGLRFFHRDDLGPAGFDHQYGFGRVNSCRGFGCPPPLPPLSVSISGPTMIFSAGSYTWQAHPVGGNGSFLYKWEESFNQSSWIQVGTAQTYTRYVGTLDSNWYLRVTVTSAGSSTSKTIFITNQSGGCNPFC